MTTALIIIDPQVDFCPGGALAVADGDAIMPVINAMMPKFDHVVVTQDWHPAGHSSFASAHEGAAPFSQIEMAYGPQTLWPDHCVIGTGGAALHPALALDPAAAIIRKGSNPAVDSYSAFFENDKETATGLAGLLRDRGVDHLTMVGLATDYCVAWSALDAVRLGFAVQVDLAACRAIDLDGSCATAVTEMDDAGITLIGG